MTENEAIKILTLSEEEQKEFPNLKEIYAIAVKALEEVQQYRAIGTVEQCREAVEKSKSMNENNNVITIGLYFEIHDAYMYGGVGTVGYANINMDLKVSALTKGNLSDYIEKQKQGVAKVCEVDVEKVLIISRLKYEEETAEED